MQHWNLGQGVWDREAMCRVPWGHGAMGPGWGRWVGPVGPVGVIRKQEKLIQGNFGIIQMRK